ncbi:MAG: hypothetical protein ACI9W4_000284 [Rhodothermales bacterium]|jgi:hypothetical protein
MSDRLIITNGGSAVQALSRAGVAGKAVSWDDVLHDGPVPGGISDTELRGVRASFLAQMAPQADGAGREASDGNSRLLQAQERLRKRDEIVESWRGPILLWFEHDLYDQLQLIQILDRLGSRPEVWLLQMEDFVTHHTPEMLRAAQDKATRVTARQYEVGEAAWAAFTAPNPRAVVGLSGGAMAPLPFLGDALGRWLDMFPGACGLSLTEGWVLDLLEEGAATGADLFGKCQAQEQAAFRGDWSFWGLLMGLDSLLVASGGPDPAERLWSLSELGHAVRTKETDRVDALGMDHWLGGTHLTLASDWRWIEGSLICRSDDPLTPGKSHQNRS